MDEFTVYSLSKYFRIMDDHDWLNKKKNRLDKMWFRSECIILSLSTLTECHTNAFLLWKEYKTKQTSNIPTIEDCM